MARAVSLRHSVVPPAGRAEFRARARKTRGHYKDAGCNYWVFEDAAMGGAFVEFFESADPESLARAHGAAPDHSPESRIYIEVELT